MSQIVSNWMGKLKLILRVQDIILKALHIQRHDELWKTHDLVALAKSIDAPEEIVAVCDTLSPIYTEDRYPDLSETIPAEKFSGEDVEQFILDAEKVLQWVQKKIT